MMEDVDRSWSQMREADRAFQNALQDFLSADKERRVAILKAGLMSARQLTLRVIQWVSIDDRKELLPDLLYLARGVHGFLPQVRNAILSLPKQWLLENIERCAEPILASGDLEYRQLLELYSEIDRNLTKRLAERALSSADPDIRETGREFVYGES